MCVPVMLPLHYILASCQLSLLRKPEPQLNYCDGLVLWFPTALACDPLRTKQQLLVTYCP